MKLPKSKGVRRESSGGSSGGGIGLPSGIGELIFAIVGTVLLIGLALFILLGGVNQVKLFQTISNLGISIAQFMSNLINKVRFEITDTGIYLRP